MSGFVPWDQLQGLACYAHHRCLLGPNHDGTRPLDTDELTVDFLLRIASEAAMLHCGVCQYHIYAHATPEESVDNMLMHFEHRPRHHAFADVLRYEGFGGHHRTLDYTQDWPGDEQVDDTPPVQPRVYPTWDGTLHSDETPQ